MWHMGQWVWGTWVMRHMGNGDTWVMGYIGNNARSRCQNLRLPYIFLISDLNTCPILMYDHANRSLEPPLQEYEVILQLGGL